MRIQYWAVLRSVMGLAFGLDDYGARCRISPATQFGRIEDDVIEEDLSYLRQMIGEAFGGLNSVPHPRMNQSVSTWMIEIDDLLDSHFITEEVATDLLLNFYKSKGGEFMLVEE